MKRIMVIKSYNWDRGILNFQFLLHIRVQRFLIHRHEQAPFSWYSAHWICRNNFHAYFVLTHNMWCFCGFCLCYHVTFQVKRQIITIWVKPAILWRIPFWGEWMSTIWIHSKHQHALHVSKNIVFYETFLYKNNWEDIHIHYGNLTLLSC